MAGFMVWCCNRMVDSMNKRRVNKYNNYARGVQQFNGMTPDLVIPPSAYDENVIISGGDASGRLLMTEQAIRNCHAQRRPAIILHLANTELENIVAQNQFGMVINQANRIFDAFTSFDLQEICQIVFDTCRSKYDIKPEGRYILQIVHTLLACKNLKPYFSNFASCPYYQLPERINQRYSMGLITDDTVNKLNSLYAMGQGECAKVDSFFYDMKSQFNHIATDTANQTGGVSVLSAIKKGEILCLDLRSSANIILVEFIVNSLTIAMNRGYEFTLVLDDVAIANNELLKNALCQKSGHNNVICSGDLYALLSGKDDVFSTLAGEAQKTILFSHSSHLSCEKWARYIGEYDKIDVSFNQNSGWNFGRKIGYNTNSGKTMADKREYKIKPEQINRLSLNEAFIYDNMSGSLIQTTIR